MVERPTVHTGPDSPTPSLFLAGIVLVTAALVVNPVPAAGAAAKPLVYAGHRYQYVAQPVGWHEAVARSEAMGGHLVTVTSSGENDFLFAHLPRSSTCGHGRGGSARCQSLLGARMQYTWDFPAEGWRVAEPWAWITGEPFRYANWSPTPSYTAAISGDLVFPCLGVHDDGTWSEGSYNAMFEESQTRLGFFVEWDTATSRVIR